MSLLFIFTAAGSFVGNYEKVPLALRFKQDEIKSAGLCIADCATGLEGRESLS